ncbi:VanW family protein [Gordonia soli]|uniref:YoaR-like putative peptidoglycan binding domain-containing protein n=1 Tax=Gordonia soli NBRC 108243 TaxID=1223545 RepID=M0QQD1_9ACTN|nr:VanW family protein [Gordonia soli]GAC70609.1 hypothetical protein GS4_38_00140 [Gordonia soli NBRC 108243]
MSQGRTRRTVVRIVVGVLAAVALVLALDLVLTHGKTARGITVAGVDMGNLSRTAAVRAVGQLSERAEQPVALRTSSGATAIGSKELGLEFDPEATVERAMEQPTNPWTRALAMVGVSRAVDPVVRVDRAELDAALDGRKSTLEKAAVEGGVRYNGTTPVGELPAGGLRIARDQAMATLSSGWLYGREIELPMEHFDPTVSADTVRSTVSGPATNATSAAVTLRGTDNTTARMSPTQIGELLTFVPDGKGGLLPRFDEKRATTMFAKSLARSERKPANATFDVRSGSPTVVPARDGASVDWDATLAQAAAVATSSDASDSRSVEVVYKKVEPKLTTDAARKLGVREVVSEYTTGGFTSASGENIRLVAEKVDGALVPPGAKFSLNTYTGPRGTRQGYVTSTVIDHGHAEKAVGGGISQFATTLYNASYFAGLEDVDHTEHSYYISRYPEAREATVFEGAIDLVFRNNTKSGIYIETSWTPSSVTVRLWGTKTVEVTSQTGRRTASTDPRTIRLPKGDDCLASTGSKGFTTSDTRVITDVRTGREISRKTRTVKYDPEPIVKCV